MLMMKVTKVLTGQWKRVRMLQRMAMFPLVSLVMAMITHMSMRKMGTMKMTIRLRVRVRLKEWPMHRKMEMGYHCHFQNVFCKQLNPLPSMFLHLYTKEQTIPVSFMEMTPSMCSLDFIKLYMKGYNRRKLIRHQLKGNGSLPMTRLLLICIPGS
uniref:Uncharacterized protein n=1 Tax=Opuntia streptacantha TaxID=393608 RepID=A0A7C9F9B6_OPUST